MRLIRVIILLSVSAICASQEVDCKGRFIKKANLMDTIISPCQDLVYMSPRSYGELWYSDKTLKEISGEVLTMGGLIDSLVVKNEEIRMLSDTLIHEHENELSNVKRLSNVRIEEHVLEKEIMRKKKNRNRDISLVSIGINVILLLILL